MAKNRQAIKGQRTRKKKSGNIQSKLKVIAGVLWRPKFIAGVVIVFVSSMIYTKINIQQVWPIKSVKIEGEFNYLDKEHLRQKALPVVHGGFISVELEAVRDVLINMPWVDEVSVRRQWPDQLLVRVIEKEPVVYWGKNSLLSTKGKLFVPDKRPSLAMPELTGPEGQHKMLLKELARMQAWLVETGLQINKMKLDARRSWILQMTTGLELRLGRKQMHERLHRFVSVYKTNLKNNKRKIKHIDMRYTNGFAVAWKEA